MAQNRRQRADELNLGPTAVLTSQHGISFDTKQGFGPAAVSAILCRPSAGLFAKGAALGHTASSSSA